MKILNAQQIKAADRYTIEHDAISSIDLMEHASKKCVDWIVGKFSQIDEFAIFCGVGNNGGDGLAIARLLIEQKISVNVYIVEFSKNYSEDFKFNLERIKNRNVKVDILDSTHNKFSIPTNLIVIDAIFGSGLNQPISGFVVDIISQINLYQVIAIDMPSGIFCENNENNDINKVVKADYTLTFQQPKLSMMFPQYGSCFGEIVVLDIGLNQEFLKNSAVDYFYTTSQIVQQMMVSRTKFSHKGTYGHALIVAGSYGKMGAAVLSVKSCLRTGVGLVTAHIPKSGLLIMQTSVPEAMCSIDDSDEFITEIGDISKYNAIGVGPGLGKSFGTQQAIKLLIQNANQPLVLDADALNILSENKTWIPFVPQYSILTPHPKEFERLVGKWSSDEERLKLQRELSVKYQLIVVLKGANTSISLPSGKVHFNSSGNSGMATAGSGDTLTGIITALLAQGYLPEKAAIIGVYLHGRAGDMAKNQKGETSMIASDIIEHLPEAFNELLN